VLVVLVVPMVAACGLEVLDGGWQGGGIHGGFDVSGKRSNSCGGCGGHGGGVVRMSMEEGLSGAVLW